jgi:hypothetical protein
VRASAEWSETVGLWLCENTGDPEDVRARQEENRLMSQDQTEHCPIHPDVEPVVVTTQVIYSAQSDYPVTTRSGLRCPVCG